ncbi:MAG: LD-carboxypeptidase [Anaerolineae bacterium]|nr:LD-carboxypeptidase [Anaerolineae bacterium]
MNNGIKFLAEMGFEVVLGQHVFSNTLGYAALPQKKAADINAMFADESVKAIICSQGGYTANVCLPYLHWQTIKANPKIFLGISDISVLLNATAEYDFPILKVNEFGHKCPNTVLPVGGRVSMDAAGHKIEILQQCVG